MNDGHLHSCTAPTPVRVALIAKGITFTERYMAGSERTMFHAYPSSLQIEELQALGFRFSPNSIMHLT